MVQNRFVYLIYSGEISFATDCCGCAQQQAQTFIQIQMQMPLNQGGLMQSAFHSLFMYLSIYIANRALLDVPLLFAGNSFANKSKPSLLSLE